MTDIFNNLQLTQQPTQSRRKVCLPPADNDAGRICQLTDLLKLNPLRLSLVNATLKFLRFDRVCGHSSWILTDASREIAVSLRLDGEPYEPGGRLFERKYHYPPGANRAWPLGLVVPYGSIPPDARIVLVVGPTEYLAACDVLACAKKPFLPVAFMDEHQPISPILRSHFAGRKVLIVTPHGDLGLLTALRWWRELAEFGATVEAKQLGLRDLLYTVGRHGATAVANMLNL